MGVFSKFFMPFSRKKNKYLPAAASNTESPLAPHYSINPYKTVASFDLTIQKPRYEGEIPEATIKFYPLD